MLYLVIPEEETFDERTNKFGVLPEIVFPPMEHSLVSLSLWETEYEKPFIDKNAKSRTLEELEYYLKCMSTEPITDDMLSRLRPVDIRKINAYLNKKSTATWFNEDNKKAVPAAQKNKVITSEVIYGWMVALQIPIEMETWNLNRLMTLIKVCQINQEPPKKMNPKTAAAEQRRLNALRKERYNTNG